MSVKTDEIIEKLKSITLLEASELIKQIVWSTLFRKKTKIQMKNKLLNITKLLNVNSNRKGFTKKKKPLA